MIEKRGGAQKRKITLNYSLAKRSVEGNLFPSIFVGSATSMIYASIREVRKFLIWRQNASLSLSEMIYTSGFKGCNYLLALSLLLRFLASEFLSFLKRARAFTFFLDSSYFCRINFLVLLSIFFYIHINKTFSLLSPLIEQRWPSISTQTPIEKQFLSRSTSSFSRRSLCCSSFSSLSIRCSKEAGN